MSFKSTGGISLIALHSRLEGISCNYSELEQCVAQYQFVLGGNWDYENGYFDRALDGEPQTVWLRIPFRVEHGSLDPAAPQPGTRVRIGQPFVLRHLYRTGNDPAAQVRTLGAFVDQFQAPLDPDATIDDDDVQEGRKVLASLEKEWGKSSSSSDF
jgi:hypothetical protein